MSASRHDRPPTAAVVVTRDAPPGLGPRLERIRAQSERVVVVDNASREPRSVQELREVASSGVDLLRNDRNLGIARALNQGVEWAAARGCATAWLLDHDTTPEPDCLERLRTAAVELPGLRAPALRYDTLPDVRCRWQQTLPGDRFRFRYVYADAMGDPQPVDHAITSGSLLDLAAFDAVGPFDEGLFIDLVDTEYCLRLRSRGFGVHAVPTAWITHGFGHVERRRWLGLKAVHPTHHTLERHYYMARNRVLVLRRHGRRFPSWAIFELVAAAKLVVKALIHEPERRRRLGMVLHGTWDGLRGVPGAIPHARRRREG